MSDSVKWIHTCTVAGGISSWPPRCFLARVPARHTPITKPPYRRCSLHFPTRRCSSVAPGFRQFNLRCVLRPTCCSPNILLTPLDVVSQRYQTVLAEKMSTPMNHSNDSRFDSAMSLPLPPNSQSRSHTNNVQADRVSGTPDDPYSAPWSRVNTRVGRR